MRICFSPSLYRVTSVLYCSVWLHFRASQDSLSQSKSRANNINMTNKTTETLPKQSLQELVLLTNCSWVKFVKIFGRKIPVNIYSFKHSIHLLIVGTGNRFFITLTKVNTTSVISVIRIALRVCILGTSVEHIS